MFYPTKLETTQKETIGKWYTRARWLASIGWMASGFVFGYVDKTIGFWILLVSSFVASMLYSRENYISAIWHIRRGGDLMERLILSGDRRFILEQLKKDAAWRGEEPDPEVTKQLAEMETAEEAFKSRVNKFLEDLTASFEKQTPPDEPKSN